MVLFHCDVNNKLLKNKTVLAHTFIETTSNACLYLYNYNGLKMFLYKL